MCEIVTNFCIGIGIGALIWTISMNTIFKDRK